MYKVKPTSKFQKDVKRLEKRGYDISKLAAVVKALAAGKVLLKKYNDHDLSGDYVGCRECHITPDWLLVYKINDDTLYLYLTRTGMHSDLF